MCFPSKYVHYQIEQHNLSMYRQSPVKSPDIKNIIVVTLTFLFTQFSTLAKTYTITAREPSMYVCVRLRERERGRER